MALSEQIKAIRVTLGETMEQFGQRFNTSKGTVNNWEKGRNAPNKANLKRIAELSDDPREFIALYLTRV
ncbi:TPA: helix-turn-helix domain-containing protein [Streptococcus suis]|nr:helix-turn-helix domain-containing protein [Streptococcus suis]HEM3669691.1 helix-turn-helix domain-containing protein [Streptococcus suis]HEM3686682.1 helix-turn-helix domain-containing protein [Streptococcus suis]HEM3693475.1 helix-turn-helix domain-containing protein [Streptococcus suis]